MVNEDDDDDDDDDDDFGGDGDGDALGKLTTVGPDGLEPNLRDLRQKHVRRTQLGDFRR